MTNFYDDIGEPDYSTAADAKLALAVTIMALRHKEEIIALAKDYAKELIKEMEGNND